MAPRVRCQPKRSPKVGAWHLRLYVAGIGSRSVLALANPRDMCDQQVFGRCKVEVIDAADRDDMARQDQVVAMPALIRLPQGQSAIAGASRRANAVAIGEGAAHVQNNQIA